VPLALVVYLTLGGVYSPLRPAAVRQLFVNELLTLIIDIAPLSLELLASLIRDGSRDLGGEVVNLLAKIGKVPALSQLIQALSWKRVLEIRVSPHGRRAEVFCEIPPRLQAEEDCCTVHITHVIQVMADKSL
jgi:hypothetical protein